MSKQGLKENWKQFALLVLVNAFVGGMVGMERSMLPALAKEEFMVAANTAILSFIIVFGLSKALTNYVMGKWANSIGRKNFLLIGWAFGIPVPFLLLYAPSWEWVVAANVFLGINQGLAWSSTVIMKIDLVGPKHRGLAMGLNESAGYLAVGLLAFVTGWIASQYGLRPYPFYLGIALSVAGLLISFFFINDTHAHVAQEGSKSVVAKLNHVFFGTSFTHPNLSSVTQAGLVNNLNDGMVWGVFPILLAAKGFPLDKIALIVAIYPAVWGIGQLFTGKLADHIPVKPLLFTGMLLQGVALIGIGYSSTYGHFIWLSILLGLGTALVYPTFLVAIAQNIHPEQRASSIGVFRLWRDAGYAVGALLTGILADQFDIQTSVLFIAILTLLSSGLIAMRMKSPLNV